MDTFLLVLMCIFGANFAGLGLNMLAFVAMQSPFDKPEDKIFARRFLHTALTHVVYIIVFSIAIVLRILALGGKV